MPERRKQLGRGWATPGRLSRRIISRHRRVGRRSAMALDGCSGRKPVLMVIGVLVGNFAAIYLIYVASVPRTSRQAGEQSRCGMSCTSRASGFAALAAIAVVGALAGAAPRRGRARRDRPPPSVSDSSRRTTRSRSRRPAGPGRSRPGDRRRLRASSSSGCCCCSVRSGSSGRSAGSTTALLAVSFCVALVVSLAAECVSYVRGSYVPAWRTR